MKKVLFILAVAMVYGLSVSTASALELADNKEKVTVVGKADNDKTDKAETPEKKKSAACSETKAEGKAKSDGCATAKSEAKSDCCGEKAKKAAPCKEKE